ncbi:MAG: sensor histidine kinase [Longimicrobiales bacterium]
MIWRKWKFWLALLGGATLVGVLEGAQVFAGSAAQGRPVTWPWALGSTVPSWYVLVALLPGIIWMSQRFRFEPGRWRRALPLHLGAAVLFAVVHVTASGWLSAVVVGQTWTFPGNPSELLRIYFVVELVTYFAMIGAYHAYEYARRYRERESHAVQLAIKTSRLEASLARANLDSLRMQLNPHFLFNTLNAISVMAMKGERKGVVRMLTLLSELLRVSLDHKQQVVSLREELEILDRYLEIEYVRFRDRLTLERDIDPAALDAEVPVLLLQPLVENAIRHGISRQPGPGVVRVEAEIMGGETIELRVLDTGPVITGAASRNGTGVGLANTRSRLEQLYGSRQELTLAGRAAGGACVTVRLPLRYYLGEPLKEPLHAANA